MRYTNTLVGLFITQEQALYYILSADNRPTITFCKRMLKIPPVCPFQNSWLNGSGLKILEVNNPG